MRAELFLLMRISNGVALITIAPESRMRMDAGRGSHESSSDNGMGMTEKEKRLAKEREEIAARVASFRATQEKFEREREEYYAKTLAAARSGKPMRFWT